MKLSCEIIQDLLPLYEDGICSEESKAVVEEHLKECSACRNQVQHIQNLLQQENMVPDITGERAVVKSFRKIRRRWMVSLAAMLLVVPILLLSINQVRGAGICYTNIDEIFMAGRFTQALEKSDYQAASEMMNFENIYYDIQSALGRGIEDYMPDFMPVTIGQSEWMAHADVYQEYFKTTEATEQFWEDVIFQNMDFMIPIDIWNTVVSKKPDAFIETEDGVFISGEIPDSGEPYIYMETNWGTYMVRQDSGLRDCATASGFCIAAGLIPAELYREGLTELENSAWKNYQSAQEYYGEAANMTMDEFCELMQERHVQKLNEYTKLGYEFKSTGYEKSEYDETQNCWEITYGIEVTYQGASYPVSMMFTFANGEIVDIKSNLNRGFLKESYKLEEALSMRYIQ